MNKIMIIAVAISVGVWSQYAMALDGLPEDRSMTAEELEYNKCTAGYIRYRCTNPRKTVGATLCSDYESFQDCTTCKKGYAKVPGNCMPNNENGAWSPGCTANPNFDESDYIGQLVYKCECSDLYSETGVMGYQFRDCSTGSIEYRCDASKKYYQTGLSIKCTVTTDSSGNFKFSRCSGCKLCDETKEYWKSSGTGYQRAYHHAFTNGNPATCTDVLLNEWRCAPKYWGKSSNGTSGCKLCPQFDEVGLTEVCNGDTCPYVNSPAGAEQKEQCYAGTWEPSLDVYLLDSTGKFRWIPENDAISAYGECNYQ